MRVQFANNASVDSHKKQLVKMKNCSPADLSLGTHTHTPVHAHRHTDTRAGTYTSACVCTHTHILPPSHGDHLCCESRPPRLAVGLSLQSHICPLLHLPQVPSKPQASLQVRGHIYCSIKACLHHLMCKTVWLLVRFLSFFMSLTKVSIRF